MHYGSGAMRFFGPPDTAGANLARAEVATVSVVRRGGATQKISVLAGQAHGLREGDIFALYPFFYAMEIETSEEAKGGILACVCRVTAFTAELRELAPRPSWKSPGTGWYAKMVTRTSLARYPILLSQDLAGLNIWQDSCAKRPSLKVHGGGEGTAAFQVVPGSHGSYSIRNRSNQSVPDSNNMLSLSHNRSPDEILDMVEHLVRFQLVKGIANPSVAPSFRNSFSAQLVSPSGENFEAERPVRLRSGNTMTLEVQNHSSRTVYLYLYDMGPRWEIRNVLKGTYEAIPARDPDGHYSGVTRKKLTMTVPTEMSQEGQQGCEDVLKVFVTSRPTSFTCLEMPKICEAPKADTGQYPLADDGEEEDGKGSDDWAALNFELHTTT